MRNEATRTSEVVQPKQWCQQEPKWRFFVTVIFSAFALVVALIIILWGGFEDSTQKWAHGHRLRQITSTAFEVVPT